MYVADFAELTGVMMKRKQLKLKDIAEYIGASSVCTKQIIKRYQREEKADSHKLKIAGFLDIDREYADVKQPM